MFININLKEEIDKNKIYKNHKCFRSKKKPNPKYYQIIKANTKCRFFFQNLIFILKYVYEKRKKKSNDFFFLLLKQMDIIF
jgi:hypothetical protein